MIIIFNEDYENQRLEIIGRGVLGPERIHPVWGHRDRIIELENGQILWASDHNWEEERFAGVLYKGFKLIED